MFHPSVAHSWKHKSLGNTFHPMSVSRIVKAIPRSLPHSNTLINMIRGLPSRNTADLITFQHLRATPHCSFSNLTSPERNERPRLMYSIYEAPGHRLEDHVERPGRIQGIVRALTSASLIGDGAKATFSSKLLCIEPTREATMDEISMIHSYGNNIKVKSIAATPKAPAIAVADLGDPDGVTFVTKSSFHDALVAVGTSIEMVERIVNASRGSQAPEGSTPSGFCVIRPPGHHATPETPLGYCIFNNVAVAARYAQRVLGLKNIMILDFDVHNGNGTCAAFWEDPTVLVIDFHEENTVYPVPEFIPSGAEDIGQGPGEGLTINVPFPRYAGHVCCVAAMKEIVIPAANRFQPDMILVSAGYDAHVTDPFQLLQMRSSTYYAMAVQLRQLADELCKGRLAFFLEGGYDADALGESVLETWLALLGEPSREVGKTIVLPHPEPEEEVNALIRRLKQIHKLF